MNKATDPRGARDTAADLECAIASMSSRRSPTLAIVVPVYKHPTFVVEALQSAIAEAERSNGVVVVVNDGCPLVETHEVLQSFALAQPEVVRYIRTPNGGLSAARNRGIRHALRCFPQLRFVYLLDADNRLSPGAMRRAIETMELTGAGWVYPNINKFGLEWNGDYAPPYSIFRHLFQNVSEAGSLVSRAVFDAGVFFDESMRKGYEDWEFWLNCVKHGFRGVPCPEFGFEYRARRESMVRDSDRAGSELLAYIHTKHKALFEWKTLLRLEHQEAPRFCTVDPAHRQFQFGSAPGVHSSTQSLSTFDKTFWQSGAYPTHFHLPPFLIVADGALIAELRRTGLADWLFWQIEDLLERHSFVFVSLESDMRRLSFEVAAPATGAALGASRPHFVATTQDCLRAVVSDPSTGWVDSLKTQAPEPSVAHVTLSGPFGRRVLRSFEAARALDHFFSLVELCRASPWRSDADVNWEWRTDKDALLTAAQLLQKLRHHTYALGPLAASALSDEPEIAFVMPVLSFGGVEQVAMQVAREFKAAGWRTRAIVTAANSVPYPTRALEVFDRVCFLNDPKHATWHAAGLQYFGHDLQKWATEGRQDRLIALLNGCRAVMNCQAMHVNEVTGWLRRQGAVTINSLHLFDRDEFHSPVGHPYLMLPYEHAYDVITVPSKHLIDICRGLAVPEEKLLLLENAPTFVASPELRRSRDAALRTTRISAERPLRVLSLGRLDRQKGVERVAAVIRATEPLPVEWRVVGSSVMGDLGDHSSLGGRVKVEPAIYDRAGVMELLLWADVVVLLSHWEGSPLLILEAQSLGAIPLATDVGAVAEMIEHGVNGYLVRATQFDLVVNEATAALASLIDDHVGRTGMSRKAMEIGERKLWRHHAAPLVARVTELSKARQ